MIGSRRLLEAWEPPSGAGRPLACLATSFTFDADFFEMECIGRFLGLSWQREGSDVELLASLLEQEGEIRSTRVCAVVDRSDNPGKRSLSWDLLAVGVRGGLLHAKVALLAWENMVRIVIGSANLTRAGYREQVEAAVVIEITPSSRAPLSLITQTLSSVRMVVGRARGSAEVPGPKQRANETLDLIAGQVGSYKLPERSTPGAPRVAVTTAHAGRPAFAALDEVWKGGRPRLATVLSPFFDSDPGKNSAAQAIADRMARRGHARLRFVLPTDERQAATVVRAPEAIAADVPPRLGPEFYRFAPDGDEPRRLHAKAIVLESDSWVAALIGSSNFTRAGLGLNPGSGHLEINFAIGCRTGTKLARELAKLIPVGEQIVPGADEWELDQDEDERCGPELPWGFAEALLLTGTAPQLRLTLDPDGGLPEWWRVLDGTRRVLLDSDGWDSAGSAAQTTVTLRRAELPTVLNVEWKIDGKTERAAWPVNADHPSRLPLPEQLNRLRLMDLVLALQSSRPLPEALARAMSNGAANGSDLEMDPLVRFSGTGRLLQRTRMVSGALAGLRPFLERPAPTLDALRWRLEGPVGPAALAKGFSESATDPDRLPGEAAFLLAELALTLGRIDWTIVASAGLKPGTIRRELAHLLADIRMKIETLSPQGPLGDYVTTALRQAI